MNATLENTKRTGMLVAYLNSVMKLRHHVSSAIHAQVHACEQPCLEGFLLQHGRAWTPWGLPQDVEPAEATDCFQAATELALASKRYFYCEGLTLGVGKPMHYAWCVDRLGRVVDPAWYEHDLHPMCREYYGVAIKTDYLRWVMLRQQQAVALLGRPELLCPHRPVKPALWKHALNLRSL